MIGAIIGDIVGSPYEFDNIKTKDFPLFNKLSIFTDDTVMTIAVGKALTQYNREDGVDVFKENLIDIMHDFGDRYPDCGFGGRFELWVLSDSRKPYNSCGNGSAMRVSPVAWYASSLEETEELAKASAEITHNHPDGIKGAQAVAAAIYLARTGKTKQEIKEYIEDKYYKIPFTLDEIRPTYEFIAVNNGTVQPALEAFFESNSFEDAPLI
jgi:type I restriction enzyme M protein